MAQELRAASDAIERLRAQSAYHWVDMTLLMDPVKQVIDAREAGATETNKAVVV